ncbi:MAG: xyloglucanase [Chloroflexota bacterium]
MTKIRKTGILFTLAAAACLLLALMAVLNRAARPMTARAAEEQPYTWQNVEIVGGGFVPGIIFNPSEEGLVYARTDIGGAYRLDTATQRWIPLLDWIGWDEWGLTGIDSLATDPVDPDRVYVLADTYTNDWDNTRAAILRSSDRGATWARTDLPFHAGGNMPGRAMGERLAIDPNDNSILYLGTRSGNGLWVSHSYGVTWTQVTTFTAVGNYAPGTGDYEGDLIGVVWVLFDPNSGAPGSASQDIYVGVADTLTATYRSTDGGLTWEPIPGQPQQGYLPYHGVLASNGVLYITYSDNCGPYQGGAGAVWKYDTNSGVWTDITPTDYPKPSWGWSFGFGGLAVDAADPDVVMVSSQESWWPDDLIFRSTDGGATWKWIFEIDWSADGWPPPRTNFYVQDISGAPWLDWGRTEDPLPETAPKLGWMIGDLEIDPFNSDRMMYVTGATIYGSDNLTDWDSDQPITITVKAQGLEETAVLDLISPPTGTAHLISALGDLGGFVHDDLDIVPNVMITTPAFSSGTGLDYAELAPNVLVRVGNGGNTPAELINLGYSLDGGLTWAAAAAEPAGIQNGGNVAVAADGGSIVWAPGNGVTVSYSTDFGDNWSASAGISASAVVESDRVDPAVFYAYHSGNFYRSVDGGATFSETIHAGWPVTASVNFKAVPGIEGDVWLAGGNEDTVYGLWHSTDGGESFARLANVEEADAVGFGAPAPGETYLAIYISAQVDGVRGIYRSDDAGATWVRINDDRHQYAWTGASITGDPRLYGRVYLSTNGRGIIYGDPYVEATPTPTVTPTVTPTPTQPAPNAYDRYLPIILR